MLQPDLLPNARLRTAAPSAETQNLEAQSPGASNCEFFSALFAWDVLCVLEAFCFGAPPAAFADPLGRNLHSTCDAVARKRNIDLAVKLKWHKLPNDTCSVARLARSQNWRTSELLPLDEKPGARSIALPPPLHQHAAARVGECAVFCSVGSQLVKNHRHGLGRFRLQRHVGTADLHIAFRERCKLSLSELGQ
jgi:hypothetical protein